MSRGLGKVERHVLAVLKEWEPKHSDGRIRAYRNGIPVSELACYVHAETTEWLDGHHENGHYLSPMVATIAEHKATCRAVHSLERKGLITVTDTQITYMQRSNHHPSGGGASHCKAVKLSVDHRGKSTLESTLTEVPA